MNVLERRYARRKLGYGISGGIIVLLGAGSAAGSLALARKVDDRELLKGR